jgi:hypothetical protein
VARKAVKIWAAQRGFGGVNNSQFDVVNVHVERAGLIW